MPPTRANGKICYIQIPTDDIEQSAEFYKRVFGWNVRKRNDGSAAFDDGAGEVSGEWMLKRKPLPAGLFVYIMVDSVEATMKLVVANGGEIMHPIDVDGPEITAHFRDPAGNLLGLYQEPE